MYMYHQTLSGGNLTIKGSPTMQGDISFCRYSSPTVRVYLPYESCSLLRLRLSRSDPDSLVFLYVSMFLQGVCSLILRLEPGSTGCRHVKDCQGHLRSPINKIGAQNSLIIKPTIMNLHIPCFSSYFQIISQQYRGALHKSFGHNSSAQVSWQINSFFSTPTTRAPAINNKTSKMFLWLS